MSNELAVRGVAIAKKLLIKSMEENKDVYVSLIECRNSPHEHMELAPSVLMMNRLCKTKIPVSASVWMPKMHSKSSL